MAPKCPSFCPPDAPPPPSSLVASSYFSISPPTIALLFLVCLLGFSLVFSPSSKLQVSILWQRCVSCGDASTGEIDDSPDPSPESLENARNRSPVKSKRASEFETIQKDLHLELNSTNAGCFYSIVRDPNVSSTTEDRKLQCFNHRNFDMTLVLRNGASLTIPFRIVTLSNLLVVARIWRLGVDEDTDWPGDVGHLVWTRRRGENRNSNSEFDWLDPVSLQQRLMMARKSMEKARRKRDVRSFKEDLDDIQNNVLSPLFSFLGEMTNSISRAVLTEQNVQEETTKSEASDGESEIEGFKELEAANLSDEDLLMLAHMFLLTKNASKTETGFEPDSSSMQREGKTEEEGKEEEKPEEAKTERERSVEEEILLLKALIGNSTMTRLSEDRQNHILPSGIFLYPDTMAGEVILLGESLASGVNDASIFIAGMDWINRGDGRTEHENTLLDMQNLVLGTRFADIPHTTNDYFHELRQFPHITIDIGELLTCVNLGLSTAADAARWAGGMNWGYNPDGPQEK